MQFSRKSLLFVSLIFSRLRQSPIVGFTENLSAGAWTASPIDDDKAQRANLSRPLKRNRLSKRNRLGRSILVIHNMYDMQFLDNIKDRIIYMSATTKSFRPVKQQKISRGLSINIMKTPSDTCLLVHPVLLLAYFKVRRLMFIILHHLPRGRKRLSSVSGS